MIGAKHLKVLIVVGLVVVLPLASVAILLSPGANVAPSTQCGGTQCGIRTSTLPTTSSSSSTGDETKSTTRSTTTSSSTTLGSTTRSTATSFTNTTDTASNCCAGQTQRLGFWLQESDIMSHYSASTFFKAMFLTPPYPSTLEVMVFAILQDQTNSRIPGAPGSFTASSLTYWGQVAAMADAYPNIRLVFEIAFNSGSTLYGLAAFDTIAYSLAQHSSVYGLGVEGEYTTETSSVMAAALNTITSVGKHFINYYPAPNVLPSGASYIVHTNFPGGDAGGYDQVGSLGGSNGSEVGIDSGYYTSYQFPGTVTCPIGASAMNRATAGWNQCVVSTELRAAVSFSPASARQFLELDVGFSSSGSFTGVSGQTTNQLWDNPTLRVWVWSDPNYRPDFILST